VSLGSARLDLLGGRGLVQPGASVELVHEPKVVEGVFTDEPIGEDGAHLCESPIGLGDVLGDLDSPGHEVLDLVRLASLAHLVADLPHRVVRQIDPVPRLVVLVEEAQLEAGTRAVALLDGPQVVTGGLASGGRQDGPSHLPGLGVSVDHVALSVRPRGPKVDSLGGLPHLMPGHGDHGTVKRDGRDEVGGAHCRTRGRVCEKYTRGLVMLNVQRGTRLPIFPTTTASCPRSSTNLSRSPCTRSVSPDRFCSSKSATWSAKG